jgi:phytoene dehydrogenase-like protein
MEQRSMAADGSASSKNGEPALDAVIVGAGFSGLYMLHRLRSMGMRAQVLERGGDVGGTWYWNRYPGARCDLESVDYQFSFSKELLAEWRWTERYATQPEILAYLNFVADRLDLRRDIRFGTEVRSASFDDGSGLWRLTTQSGTRLMARFCILARRVPFGAQAVRNPRHRPLRWRVVPHGPLAPRRRRLHRQARRGHRNREHRRPTHPKGGGAGLTPQRFRAKSSWRNATVV